MIIHSPLWTQQSKTKKFYLNLNVYRNAHFHTLNKAKVEYKKLVKDQILLLPKMDKIRVSYWLYPKTKRRTDLGNIISIHQKFFEDALVEFGIIPDDSYEHVIQSAMAFGELDKENPRVDIFIEEVQCK